VQGDPGTDSHCLISDLFDVCSNSTVEEMNQKTEIRIPWDSGIVGHVAKSGIPLNIPDCYLDERFNQEVDNMTGYRTRSMLCNPIKDSNGEVIGVAQVINKACGERNTAFNHPDEVVFEKYLQFCGIGLRNAQLYERSQLEVKRNQVLLDLAGVIFQEQSTIDTLVFRILTHMLSLIRCERAMLLLVHEDPGTGTFSRVFDLEASDLDKEAVDAPYEGRFPLNTGITGYVAATGLTINLVDAYQEQYRQLQRQID
jgi:dual 3',5'-cyclic-AMP and -GMP phosphodiesterase 11